MPSKKDLEQQFGISDNTVYKTLKACGLDTSKEDYSEEEIENYFRVAREMLDSGKRYKDVEEYFGLSDAGQAEEEHNHQAQQSTSSSSAADAVGMAAAEMAVDMVQDAVKKITPHIPHLIAHTLASEMRSEDMKAAFDNVRTQIKQQKETSNNAGVDFLLEKMNNNNSGAKQLGGTHNQAQLPEASPTPSEEN